MSVFSFKSFLSIWHIIGVFYLIETKFMAFIQRSTNGGGRKCSQINQHFYRVLFLWKRFLEMNNFSSEWKNFFNPFIIFIKINYYAVTVTNFLYTRWGTCAALAGGRVERGKVVERELVWEIGFISISSKDAPIITCFHYRACEHA